MSYRDAVWFWRATFTDGSTFTFWADSKALASDHAATVGRDVSKTLKAVARLGHDKDLTEQDRAFAGTIHPAVTP